MAQIFHGEKRVHESNEFSPASPPNVYKELHEISKGVYIQ